MDFSQCKNVKAVFDLACSKLIIDKTLYQKLEKFKIEFVTRNEDHISFFGGNLIGCYVVRFGDSDRSKVFSDILKINEHDIAKPLNKFINQKDYKVAGDPFNLAMVWLTHKFENSNLNPHDKEEAKILCLEILHFKFLTSRMWRHWQYPCSVAEAEALNASLTNKFYIKQYGSWLNLIRERSAEIVDMKHSTHAEAIRNMAIDITLKGTGDKSVAYVLTDTQTRVRSMLKKIYNIFITNHSKGVKIGSSSSVAVGSEGNFFRDGSKTATNMISFINEIAYDQKSLIKENYLGIISRILPTLPIKYLREFLVEYSKSFHSDRSLIKLNENIIQHAVSYLSQNNELNRKSNDLVFILQKLKGTYMASRGINPVFKELKDQIEDIIEKKYKITRTPAHISATRTGFLLYIFLRSYNK